MDPSQGHLVAEVERLGSALKQSSDAVEQRRLKRELLQASHKLSIELQTPGELVEQMIFAGSGSLRKFPIDGLLIKIRVDLGIFTHLEKADHPLTIDELGTLISADKPLLGRILRGLASIHAVDEADVEVYRANKISHCFASNKGMAGISLFHDFLYPAWHPTPQYLRETKYRNPTDPSHLPFHLAYSKPDFFSELVSRPDALENFQRYMISAREGHVSWLDFYPFEDRVLRGLVEGDDAVTVVDMGGSTGHELKEIKQRFPALPGRLVLQDLPTTIEKVVPDDWMEATAHDFFTPQPIRGARAYYLRAILHDWDDDKCCAILNHIKDAMKPGYSKILINDFAIPLKNASSFATHSDFMVMALAGAVERTEKHWRELVASVGLRIDQIWTGEPTSESIIEISFPETS